MKQAAVICTVMGPEKSREILLPYLLTKKGELDQVTLAMAHSLEDFLPHIGGITSIRTHKIYIYIYIDIERSRGRKGVCMLCFYVYLHG